MNRHRPSSSPLTRCTTPGPTAVVSPGRRTCSVSGARVRTTIGPSMQKNVSLIRVCECQGTHWSGAKVSSRTRNPGTSATVRRCETSYSPWASDLLTVSPRSARTSCASPNLSLQTAPKPHPRETKHHAGSRRYASHNLVRRYRAVEPGGRGKRDGIGRLHRCSRGLFTPALHELSFRGRLAAPRRSATPAFDEHPSWARGRRRPGCPVHRVPCR